LVFFSLDSRDRGKTTILAKADKDYSDDEDEGITQITEVKRQVSQIKHLANTSPHT
jgi:hypothetical protein